MSSSKTCLNSTSREVDPKSTMVGQHSRCFPGKQRLAILFLVIYTVLMSFTFLSYLYTSDASTGSAAHKAGKDVIILKKSMTRHFLESVDPEGRTLLQISMPKPGAPAQVKHHFKSLRTGEALDKKCKKCAVISSSGHMLDSKRGREIDDMPCVIRMNNSPTVGFEDDVGARTTIRIVCHMSAEPINADAENILAPPDPAHHPEKILFFGLNEPNHKWALEKVNVMVDSYPGVDFYGLDPTGETQFDLIFQNETGKNKYETNTWLSTGWYTILLALDVCDEVHIYGMVDQDYCQHNVDSKIRYHYFQTWDNPTECDYYKSHEDTRYLGGHRFITEKAIFSRWGSMFNLSFHQPDWTPPKLDPGTPLKTPFVSRDEDDKSTAGKLFEQFAKWAFGSMM